jgi:hypothetical protein
MSQTEITTHITQVGTVGVSVSDKEAAPGDQAALRISSPSHASRLDPSKRASSR